MLAFKLVGCAVVLLCGAAYPRLCARERRLARGQAETLLALVRFVREQIEYYRMPLDAILARCDGDILCRFGKGSTLLERFDATPWQDGEIGAIAREFAHELGRGYFSEQLTICQRALKRLELWLGCQADVEVKRAKTEGVFGIGAAVLTVILFV